MKTLKEIATENEIAYLLENGLIQKNHVTDEPEAIREISEKETEVEFDEGLVVTIYDAAEPTAEFRENEKQTVTLVNPWSKSTVHKPVAEIIAHGLAAYPWPENVLRDLDGMYDTDEEWAIEAVKMMGPELAGEIIIGS